MTLLQQHIGMMELRCGLFGVTHDICTHSPGANNTSKRVTLCASDWIYDIRCTVRQYISIQNTPFLSPKLKNNSH